MDDNNIVNALRKYYCENNHRNRAESFINNMGGEEEIAKYMVNKVKLEGDSSNDKK